MEDLLERVIYKTGNVDRYHSSVVVYRGPEGKTPIQIWFKIDHNSRSYIEEMYFSPSYHGGDWDVMILSHPLSSDEVEECVINKNYLEYFL